MTQQSRRDEIIAHYESVRAELVAALDGLTEAQMREEPPGQWSIKDNLAHLTVWDEIRIAEIERIGGGGSPAWPVMDEAQVNVFNNLTAELRRGLSLEQVMSELKSTRARLLDAVRNANERALDEGLYGEAPLKSGHDLDHAADIRAWRSQKGI